MKLVFGGAYQGKLTWARETYGLAEAQCHDCRNGLPETAQSCLYHLEEFTYACAKAGLDAPQEMDRHRELWKDAVLILRDIGSGVVPMDKTERAWREENGKLLRYLAREAERVSRIFCGLEERLK